MKPGRVFGCAREDDCNRSHSRKTAHKLLQNLGKVLRVFIDRVVRLRSRKQGRKTHVRANRSLAVAAR